MKIDIEITNNIYCEILENAFKQMPAFVEPTSMQKDDLVRKYLEAIVTREFDNILQKRKLRSTIAP